ncbi:MAG: invasion associated locus B family protein [Pseudomonadota bacterium]
MRRWVQIAVAGVLLTGGAHAAQAQTAQKAPAAAAKTGSVITGWNVSCATPKSAGKLVCEVNNSVLVTPRNSRFVSVAIRPDGKSDKKVLVASLPHGVLFTAGVSLKIDGRDAGKLEMLTSDQNGAYARTPMSAQLAKAMKAGNTFTVVFDGTNAKRFTVGLPLAGFTAAYNKMSGGN